MRTIPLILAQATINLYPSDAVGHPLLDEPIWIGARVENLELLQEIEEIDTTPSGAIYPDFTQGYESHEIKIVRIWVLSGKTLKDYAMQRGRYVMVIHGEDRATGVWHKRTYFGVQARRYDLRSNGVMHFGAEQLFRAQHFVSDQGINGTPTPGACIPNELPISFVHEFPLIPENYLIGVYQFPVQVQITTAKAIALAGQTTATELTLEVGNLLTGMRLVLSPGSVGQEVSAAATLNHTVDANAPIRWKATSGPIENAPTMVGLTMNVREA